MRILLFTHLFPSEYEPNNGIYNLHRVKALKNAGHDIVVAVPVSIIPPVKYMFPLPHVKKIYDYIKMIYSLTSMTDGHSATYYLGWIPIPGIMLWRHQHIFLYISIKCKISKIISVYKPDLIITSVLHPEGSCAKYFKQKYNLPVITIAEGSEVLVYPSLYKGFKEILDRINTFSDKVIFVSAEMEKELTCKYHFNNYYTINNGYDNEIFNYTPRRSRNGLSVRIISVGNLNNIKGHDLLLEAVKKIPNAILTIVGDGDLYGKYARYISNNRIQDRVVIKGYTKPKELNALLNANDIFCMPSRSESFGIASVEALACGMPVVASKKRSYTGGNC